MNETEFKLYFNLALKLSEALTVASEICKSLEQQCDKCKLNKDNSSCIKYQIQALRNFVALSPEYQAYLEKNNNKTMKELKNENKINL